MKDWLLEDPLHEILERHLFRLSTEEAPSSEMVGAVIADYLLFLDSQGAHVPMSQREAFVADLKEEIRELTIKMTFGAVAIEVNPQTSQQPHPKINRRLI